MTDIAADVARRLGGHRSGKGWLCRCPVPSHGQGRGDRRPSLLVSDDRQGGIRMHCFAGCDARSLHEAIFTRTGIDIWRNRQGPATVAIVATAELGHCGIRTNLRVSAATPLRPAATEQDGNDSATASFRRRWREAVPAEGTPADRYLRQTRRIPRETPLPRTLRYHPRLWHKDERRWLPALIAAVQDLDGTLVAVHRTYLHGCEKAPIQEPKKALGPITGAAVRLAPAADGMLIGEGIEDVLTVMAATGRPGWAALGNGNMSKMVLPPDVRSVIILADNDPPGLKSAYEAAERWDREGRQVRISRPPVGVKDFNALMMEPRHG